jgi:RPE4 domain-containing protein
MIQFKRILYIPNLYQKAIFGLLRFPFLALKKIRHRFRLDSSFLKPRTKKSRRPKHSFLKQFGYMNQDGKKRLYRNSRGSKSRGLTTGSIDVARFLDPAVKPRDFASSFFDHTSGIPEEPYYLIEEYSIPELFQKAMF